jgi:hypothetical protein
MLLGDNIIQGSIRAAVDQFRQQEGGARIVTGIYMYDATVFSRNLGHAEILSPVPETRSANPLAAGPNLPANLAFVFSRRSDATPPESSVLSSPPDRIRRARSTKSFTLLFEAFLESV